jgi:hypothetical protein
MWKCYEEIVDRIKTMCRLRGCMVKPVVRLSRRKMKTTYGVKQRPHLEVVRWVKFGNPPEAPALAPPPPPTPTPPTPPAAAVSASPAPSTPTLAVPPTQPAAPTVATSPATRAPATPPAKAAPSPPVDEFGEPVEPVTLGEEMNDEIPF